MDNPRRTSLKEVDGDLRNEWGVMKKVLVPPLPPHYTLSMLT
jgi:hypothetical protein